MSDSMGYVYFIQAKRCKLIKIGASENPKVRLRSLQNSGPDELTLLAIMPGGIEMEQKLHRLFASARQHGEWFKPTKRLRTFIAKALAEHDQTVTPYIRARASSPAILPPPPHRIQRPSPERVAALFGVSR
jgi:T5orf172 domain